MSVTLRSLVDAGSFPVRFVVAPPDDAADAPITWVHSSDLPDPTPWLEPGQLLLTNGAQFLGDDADPEDYVARLVEAQVLGLGFATHVLHAEIPPAVHRACSEQGLCLLDVADRTPFIGIVRHVADRIAVEREDRLRWSLEAHRALARAALRPDGLAAVLAELERRLGCWVALYDGTGEPIPITTARPVPRAVLPVATDAVRMVLARGRRAALRVAAGDTEITVQTVGQRGHLRGALVVGAATELDPAGTDLVTSVIALASIALDQTRSLDTARRRLRTGLLELLLSGESTVAQRTAQELWGPLPTEPLQVILLVGAPTEMIMTTLEQYISSHASELFYAERDDRLHLIVAADRLAPVLRLIGAGVEHGAGVSSPVSWADLAHGVEEARRSLALTGGGARLVRFAELADQGLLGLLQVSGGGAVARRMLAPLLERPAVESAVLLESITVWLDHQCAWEPAAQQLRVHRHTLRNRVERVGGLVDRDLSDFGARAELWAALQLVSST